MYIDENLGGIVMEYEDYLEQLDNLERKLALKYNLNETAPIRQILLWMWEAGQLHHGELEDEWMADMDSFKSFQEDYEAEMSNDNKVLNMARKLENTLRQLDDLSTKPEAELRALAWSMPLPKKISIGDDVVAMIDMHADKMSEKMNRASKELCCALNYKLINATEQSEQNNTLGVDTVDWIGKNLNIEFSGGLSWYIGETELAWPCINVRAYSEYFEPKTFWLAQSLIKYSADHYEKLDKAL